MPALVAGIHAFGAAFPKARRGWPNKSGHDPKICFNVIDPCSNPLRDTKRSNPMRAPRPAKRQTINLRIKAEECGLIDLAAKTLGKSRAAFILESACRAADHALLDRTILAISPKAYAEFTVRLDAPPKPNARLRRSLKTSAPWK
jgi:uncharacterized protein (DUF1778 family)